MDQNTRHALGLFLMLFSTLWIVFTVTPWYVKRWKWAKEIVDTEFAGDLENFKIEPSTKIGRWVYSKLKR